MKKIGLVMALLFLLAAPSYGAPLTVYFDASGALQDTVFGIQADYELSGGGLLTADALTIHYNRKFTGAGVEDADGAVPGTDLTDVGLGVTTDWDIGPANNAATGGSNAIVGYTLGDDPLGSGAILTVNLDEGVDLLLTEWVLSDATGNPGAFMEGVNFFVSYDEGAHAYTVSGTPVPIPSTVLLLGSGLFGLVALRRKGA